MALGLVRRLSEDATYTLGSRVLDLARYYLDYGGLYNGFIDAAREFRAATGETVQLGRLEGVEVVYVAKLDGHRPVQLASSPGARLPTSTTALGKALLSMLPQAELEARFELVDTLPRMTEYSVRTKDELFADVRHIVIRGVAFDQEETALGLTCVAVPLLSFAGSYFAISASVPRIKIDEVSEIIESLQHMRHSILDRADEYGAGLP